MGAARQGSRRHCWPRFSRRWLRPCPLRPAGGDVKGSAKVEPYAYWPLDRRLMNRRAQKSKGAKQGLDKIVVAAKSGAAKGNKAKRQRRR